MHLSELPAEVIVLDLETIALLLVNERTNQSVSLFVQMVDEKTVRTTAEVRAKYRDYSGRAWVNDGLDHVEVKALDRSIQGVMAGMVDTCVANGLDPRNNAVQSKLALVAIALMSDGCVVSADARQTNFSMSHICSCFNVPFVDVTDLQH